jgi:hypothetical protein
MVIFGMEYVDFLKYGSSIAGPPSIDLERIPGGHWRTAYREIFCSVKVFQIKKAGK